MIFRIIPPMVGLVCDFRSPNCDLLLRVTYFYGTYFKGEMCNSFGDKGYRGIFLYHQGGKGTLPTLGFGMVLVQEGSSDLIWPTL